MPPQLWDVLATFPLNAPGRPRARPVSIESALHVDRERVLRQVVDPPLTLVKRPCTESAAMGQVGAVAEVCMMVPRTRLMDTSSLGGPL